MITQGELALKAINALEEGLNISVSEGAYKDGRTVSNLVSAVDILNNYIINVEKQKQAEKENNKKEKAIPLNKEKGKRSSK